MKCYDHFSSNVKTERFARYPIILVVILCGTLSMIMNMAYKDNYTNARAMIKYYPESSIPYLLLGHYYFDKNEQLLAVEYYEKYLQLSLLERRANKQQQFVARYQLALSYSSLKNMERAIDGLTDALKHFPKSPEINQHLAYLYDYQGDYPKAVNFALAAISLKPNSPQAYIFAVNGYLELGQKQQAEIYLQNALEYLPSDDPNLQILLRKMNND